VSPNTKRTGFGVGLAVRKCIRVPTHIHVIWQKRKFPRKRLEWCNLSCVG